METKIFFNWVISPHSTSAADESPLGRFPAPGKYGYVFIATVAVVNCRHGDSGFDSGFDSGGGGGGGDGGVDSGDDSGGGGGGDGAGPGGDGGVESGDDSGGGGDAGGEVGEEVGHGTHVPDPSSTVPAAQAFA